MYVIPVAKNTVTEIVVIEIASGVKVAVAQEIASEDDEGVNLAIKSDHAVLEVVLVPAATVQGHVIAKGQKGRGQKLVIEAEEIGIARILQMMNGVKLGLRTSLKMEMTTIAATKMNTPRGIMEDTMLKSRLSRSLKIVSLLAPMETMLAVTGIEGESFKIFLPFFPPFLSFLINKQILWFSSPTYYYASAVCFLKKRHFSLPDCYNQCRL